MRRYLAIKLIALCIACAAIFNSCDEAAVTPPDDTNSLQLSDASKSAATVGWQTINSLKTESQISQTVKGTMGGITDEIGIINTPIELHRTFNKARQTRAAALHAGILNKLTGDSLIWMEEWDDPVSGTAGRRALYYDAQNGNGRIYEVIYKFPQHLQLTYDSTEVTIYFGNSLADTTDDKFLKLYKNTKFNADFVVREVIGIGEATHWDSNNEVTGATVSNEIFYGNQIEIEKLTQQVDFLPDRSGSVMEKFHYRDNTESTRQISYLPDHTGTYSEVWRDGTTVSGTFDEFGDDYHAAFTRTIQFSNHPWLDKINDRAEYTFNPTDSSSNGTVGRLINFLDGTIDSLEVTAQRQKSGDFWTETLQIQTAHDGSTNVTITEKNQFNEFTGEHFSPEGLYIRFNGTEYQNGSGELWLYVYTSKTAYDNGEPPILTAHYIYNPDGSGNGTLSENGKDYQISFEADGEVKVTASDGHSLTLNGYEN